MIFRAIFTLVSILCLGTQPTDGKVVHDKVKLRMDYDDLARYSPGRAVVMDGLHYITHFACQIGKCTWELRVRATNPARALTRANSNRDYIIDESRFTPIQNYGIWRYFDKPSEFSPPYPVGTGSVNMRVILDAEWNDKKLSRSFFNTKMAGKECMGDIKSRLTRSIDVPLNGEWSSVYSGALLQKARPHHWYFVLEDCEGNYLKNFSETFGIKPHAYLPNVQFEYEMTLLNVDGSHLGYEYWGMASFTFIVGLLSFAGLIFFVFKQVSMKRAARSVHPIVQCVNLSLLTLVLYLLLHWFHLVKFKSDGIGYPRLDALGIFLRSIGNITIMLCVFAVALGYSLNVNEMTIPGEAFLALSTCYGVVELILTFAQYQTNSFRYHIHASEGVIPIIISVFRMIIAAAFVISCEATRTRNDYTNDNVRLFMAKFRWRGMVMISSSAVIIVIISLFFPVYQQNRYLEMIGTIADLASLIYLGIAFITSKTSFFKASVMGNSLLPFGGGGINASYRNSAHHRLD